jgi:hypothetical protein
VDVSFKDDVTVIFLLHVSACLEELHRTHTVHCKILDQFRTLGSIGLDQLFYLIIEVFSDPFFFFAFVLTSFA